MPMKKGDRQVFGKVGYAPQVSWIFSGTLKENILFDREYEPAWYDNVIKSCCLEADIEILPKGIVLFETFFL